MAACSRAPRWSRVAPTGTVRFEHDERARLEAAADGVGGGVELT